MMETLEFRDSFEVVDSKFLTALVKEHDVEYFTKPLERRDLWSKITERYNNVKSTNFTHERLSKRWHNMKQRARKKISSLKKKVRKECNTESEGNSAVSVTDDLRTNVNDLKETGNDTIPINVKKLRKKKLKKVKLRRKEIDKLENDQIPQELKDDLLKNLLMCLAKKYKVDEKINASKASRMRVWKDLSREYYRLTGGMENNVDEKHLLKRWNNFKTRANYKEKPPSGNSQNNLDIDTITQKLRPLRQQQSDAEVEKQLEAELQKNYLFAAALHGHRLSPIDEDVMEDFSPNKNENIQSKNISVRSMLEDIDANEEKLNNGESTHLRSLKEIEKNIFLQSLKYEEERIQSQRETGALQKQKLMKELELADIQIANARRELENKQFLSNSNNVTFFISQ